jgi:hypothetical protein
MFLCWGRISTAKSRLPPRRVPTILERWRKDGPHIWSAFETVRVGGTLLHELLAVKVDRADAAYFPGLRQVGVKSYKVQTKMGDAEVTLRGTVNWSGCRPSRRRARCSPGGC